MRGFALLLALVLPAAPALGQTVATAWLSEGKVFLVRGATLHAAPDAVKVAEGDLVATEAKSQVQLQFNDGTIVNAGPATRLMVVSPRGPELALAAGWLKVVQKAGAKNMRVWTPAGQLTLDEATAVVQVGPAALHVFLESGTAAVADLAEKAPAPRRLKAGEFLASARGQKTVQPRPGREFIESMPRHFRDPLPALPDKVRERKVEPRREREVTYDDVADWLKSPMPVRRGFVKRFAPRAADPQFRASLVANVREHPEWDRFLFPEKYEPKEPPKGPGEVNQKQPSGGKS